MKTAIGYIRVSTNEQAIEGISLEAQGGKVKQYCQLKDFDLVEIIEDAGVSGKDLNRPGVQRVLGIVKSRNVDAVVVYKLDRLSRSTIDCLLTIKEMDKAGIAFHSITEAVDTKSAMGRFFLTILAAAAQMERDRISERTIDVLQTKKAQGERVGTIPFGYQLADDGCKMIENLKEQKILKKIWNMRKKSYTLQEIADGLNKAGYRTRRGGEWRYQNVQNLLKKVA